MWEAWQREYLPALTTRAKWQAEERDARVDDLVLVVEANLPRGVWRLGKITEVYRGKNGRVRSAKVLTINQKQFDKDGTLTSLKPDLVIRESDKTYIERSVTKLCLLQAADQDPVTLPEASKTVVIPQGRS